MKFVLVSHGPFAKGLLESVQMVLGEQKDLTAYCLLPEEPPSALTERLEAELSDAGEEKVLFLTDLYHGTPFNVVVSLMRNHQFGHVTGINLPLLIEALMNRNAGVSMEQICSQMVESAKGTTLDVNELLKEEEEE